MKNKSTPKNPILKISVIAVLIISILTLGFYIRGQIELVKNDPKNDPLPSQTYSVTLDDYKVYQFMDVQYDFIMANVTIASNETLNLTQNLFTTAENINLANTSEYTNYLSSQGYELKCPLPESSTALSDTRCLFIPILNRSLNELILKVSIDRIYNLSFNVNDIVHAGTREMLGVEEPLPDFVATVIDKKLISTHSFFTVNNDGDHEAAMFNSQSQVFGIQVTLQNNTKSPIHIENTYIKIDDKGTFQAIDSTFSTEEYPMLLGKDITAMTTGYLFMEVTDETIDLSSLANKTIHVFIKLSSENNYIEVLFLGNT